MLKKGTLWDQLAQAGGQALAAGAQKPIPTEFRVIKDDGIPFIVRVVEQLAQKSFFPAETTRDNGEIFNPFLPYDPKMFVTNILPTHVGLLNKFNVVDNHLLIVTREFESQESLLTRADFEALCACMAEFRSLGFYNSGASAGASQPHKHLQLVPLPLSPYGPELPIESLLSRSTFKEPIGQIKALPFAHAIARIAEDDTLPPSRLAAVMTDTYHNMLQTLNLHRHADDGGVQPSPYNLLVAPHWLMVVPRSREYFGPISLNALAFAGTFLVRDEAGFRELETHGPMAALQHVGVPA